MSRNQQQSETETDKIIPVYMYVDTFTYRETYLAHNVAPFSLSSTLPTVAPGGDDTESARVVRATQERRTEVRTCTARTRER